MEIRTGSSDSNSLRDESSSFDRVQRRSNESKSKPSSWSEKSRRIKRSKNEIIGYKRSRESGSEGPERKIQKGSEHRVPKRALSANYKTNSILPKFKKRSRIERRNSNAQHKRLQPQTTKWKRTRVPTSHGDEDTTGRTSSIQERQRKETQPLHRRANKIRQQECQKKR
ncbi:uncharacterized protein TNCV_2465231 [Trichonephila clavipes]|uniref:Uncharacterized protein n=1 Tax=Trichonephila clavipes TaxID=2585209 RepID=A0A8X6RC32_TRICX|nr:uncharacterized protein TNCV_2465231 [Trichonephila clavipes]